MTMPLAFANFFFNDTETTEIYTLSLHDALPILNALLRIFAMSIITPKRKVLRMSVQDCWRPPAILKDRKSGSAGMPRPTSYAVFCLKKKRTSNDILFVCRAPPDARHRYRRGDAALV